MASRENIVPAYGAGVAFTVNGDEVHGVVLQISFLRNGDVRYRLIACYKGWLVRATALHVIVQADAQSRRYVADELDDLEVLPPSALRAEEQDWWPSLVGDAVKDEWGD